MSPFWFLFASLAIIGGSSYTVFMKFGASNVNPFWFTFIMTAFVLVIQGVFCLTAKYAFNADLAQGMTAQTWKYAALCGGASALINVTYFLALRYGTVIPTQLYWAIGDILLTSALAVLLFNEMITWPKALGLALGVVSIFLITKV